MDDRRAHRAAWHDGAGHATAPGTGAEPGTVAPTGLERCVIAAFAAATIGAIVAPVAGRTAPWIGGTVALAALAATPRVARALPRSLDGVARRRRAASIAWVLLAVIGVVQMARLSAFMADPSRTWGSTVPGPLTENHQCLSAYVYAADLSRRGVANLYDTAWYPIFDLPGRSCRVVSTPVHGLSRWIGDAYEYPPPFLLAPRAALALTSSYDAIRAWWFVTQALALIGAGVLLGVWVGGAAGLTIALLIPAALASIETMLGLQFGQFHAMAALLACAAMVAFDGRRRAWGGALLAAAILSKAFPAILLVVLAARRQWVALAWTAGFGAAFGLMGLAVLGPAPYLAFVSYQLPRLVNGEAFHFTHLGSQATFLISRNLSIAGLGAKLGLLGAPAAAIAAVPAVTWIYTIALLALAVWAAPGGESRVGRALVWIGLLDLAALRSPEAPAAYVLAPVLWLLMVLATRIRGRKWFALALGLAWALVVGPPPLPDRVDLSLGLGLQAFAFAVCAAAVWWGRRSAEAAPEFAASRIPATSVASPMEVIPTEG